MNITTVYVLAKAYRTLGLLRHTFSNTINIQVMQNLYISLIKSQLSYCSQPYLLRDIAALEQLQRRSTKFILNDYVSDYKTRLIKLISEFLVAHAC